MGPRRGSFGAPRTKCTTGKCGSSKCNSCRELRRHSSISTNGDLHHLPGCTPSPSPGPQTTSNSHFSFEPPNTPTISASKLVSSLSPLIKRKVISALQSMNTAQQGPELPPKSNMFLAVLTMFVCPPLGVLAWHHAKKVKRLWESNDMANARASSKMAGTLSYIGFLIGGLLVTAVFVVLVLVEFF